MSDNVGRRAVRLHLEGKSWEKIAEVLGLGDAEDAEALVRGYVGTRVVDVATERNLELIRLEDLESQLREELRCGEAEIPTKQRIVRTLLRIHDQRDKLLGLSQPKRVEGRIEMTGAGGMPLLQQHGVQVERALKQLQGADPNKLLMLLDKVRERVVGLLPEGSSNGETDAVDTDGETVP